HAVSPRCELPAVEAREYKCFLKEVMKGIPIGDSARVDLHDRHDKPGRLSFLPWTVRLYPGTIAVPFQRRRHPQTAALPANTAAASLAIAFRESCIRYR